METFEKKLGSKTIYDGKVIKLRVDDVLLPSERKAKREVVQHRNGVGVLTFYEDKVVIVKQFRYVFGCDIYEIPAGKVEDDENPVEACIRELQEETGFLATELKPLGVFYPSCGYSTETVTCYYTTVSEKTRMHLDLDEFINVEYWDFDELKAKIQNNEIKDAKTIFAVYQYLNLKK